MIFTESMERKNRYLNFFNEVILYIYIVSAFFSSKFNMKVGYVLLIATIINLYFNKDNLKYINKKIFGSLLLIFILGCPWNYISAGFVGLSKFINMNGNFIYGIAFLMLLPNVKKESVNIFIFLAVNVLSLIFLYKENLSYILLDDLGRVRIILLLGWMYISFLALDKIMKNLKNIYLFLFLIFPFLALGKGESRMGFLGIIFCIIFYFTLKIVEDRKNLKKILILTLIVTISFKFIPSNYIERIKTSFNTTTDMSNKDRVVMWKAGVEIYKKNYIWGVGSAPKNIHPLVQEYVRENVQEEALRDQFLREARFAKLHNMYLDFFVEDGILGILFLILFFYIIPLEFFKGLKNSESISAFLVIIFYYFYGLSWSLWTDFGISQVLFYIFLAIMLYNLKEEKSTIYN